MNGNILLVKSTKEMISFRCSLKSIRENIVVKTGDPVFEDFKKKNKNVTYDKETRKVIVNSSESGLLIGEEGNILIKSTDGDFYPTTSSFLREAIEKRKSGL